MSRAGISNGMTPERWALIDEVFNAAAELGPEERAAYLAEACAGDEDLRREVESLIESEEREGSFMASPIFRINDAMPSTEARLAAGEKLNSYEILGVLGEGGMGVVYLARDTKLNRKVALKLLPPSLKGDGARLRRLRREAQAASALNHPNILTIHEVGEAEHGTYIATEYVEGETLRERMKAGLALEEALDIAAQVASALDAAHSAGVIHRDVKPENVMVRRDGYVKVLDFGLAKLSEWQAAGTAAEARTRSMLGTEPGVVMGTARYMSPEQSRGREVDARTDVFSLGVVLYEMVAKRPPFEGDTPSDIVATLLRDEPPDIVNFLPRSPDRLQAILHRALRKDRSERFQSMGELLSELKTLRNEINVAGNLVSSEVAGGGLRADGPPLPVGGRVTNSGYFWQRTASQATTSTGGLSRQGAAEDQTRGRGPANLLTLGARRKALLLPALAVLLAVAAALALPLYRRIVLNGGDGRAGGMSVTKLTNAGTVSYPAISPDGKYLVYAKFEAGNVSLWLKQITTGSEVQIAPPAQAGYWGASFTPDGQYIYYALVENQQNPLPSLYQISTLGGTPKKVLSGLASPFSLSPDGLRIAFTRRDRGAGTMSLNVSRADGSEERTIATRKEPDLLHLPTWSPDGASITCINADVNWGQPRLVSFAVSDRTESPITTPKFYRIISLAWLHDSSGLVLIAKESAAKPQQIWHVSYPGGETRRITNDLLHYVSLSLSADSASLVTNQVDEPGKLWLFHDIDLSGAKREGPPIEVSRGNPIPPIQLTPGRHEGVYGLSWTPDGKIVYASDEGGYNNIWVTDVGGNRRHLTTGDYWDSSPSVSPDGRYVAFVSDRAGAQHVWRMNSDGGNQIQLTSGSVDTAPQFSPDGNWVIYNSAQGGTVTVWKVPIEGGQPTQVTRTHSLCPVISPDGRFMAYTYKDEGAGQMKIGVIPSEGGDLLKSFDIARNVQADSLRWVPDGRALIYKRLTEGNSNLWRQDLAGGEPRKLSNFTYDGPFYCDWSRDAKQLACARGSVLRDAVMITNFR